MYFIMCEIESGKSFPHLVIKDAMLVNGRGSPAFGPVDIVIERDKITDIVKVDSVSLNRYPSDWERPSSEYMIDAIGMYVIPGLVDMHAHIPTDKKKCGPKDFEYAYKLWLIHGVTTLRTCGHNNDDILLMHRKLSQKNNIIAPRLIVLSTWPNEIPFTKDEAKEQVHKINEMGADGIKLYPGPNFNPDILFTIREEINKIKMSAGVAIHITQYSEIDAEIASNALGEYLSIEHTYGIPQAAIYGTQNFPPNYNYLNELDRFRLSGKIWEEADKYEERVIKVLDILIKNGTIWDPTMVIYECNCDLERIQTKNWHKRYTVPSLMNYWKPTIGRHASHYYEWKTSDEITWKKKFRIWMKYLKIFFERGGIITVGSDAGSSYGLYGFSTIRELELLQEVGFHPIDIFKMATTNATKHLGLSNLAGGVRVGFTADLAIVDGNPLDNFKVMYGTGNQKILSNGNIINRGGVKWTIKNGIVFNTKILKKEIEEYVTQMNGRNENAY